MAETPRWAHLMLLILLATGLAVVSGIITSAIAVLRRSKVAFQLGALIVLIPASCYAVLLLIFSIASHDQILSTGEWKYFCEPDCHIAYSLSDTQTASTLGAETTLLQARGEFVKVRLKSWFDENSIAKSRGNAPLRPVPRIVSLIDQNGSRFYPLLLRPGILPESSAPLSRELRPGESYETSLIFDIPKSSYPIRLLIVDDDPVATVTIDHENSPFHGKIYFDLTSTRQSVAKTTR